MPDVNPQLEQTLSDLSAKLVSVNDLVKSQAEKANTEIKNLGAVTAETKLAADKVLAAQGDITARLNEVEQAMARSVGSGAASPKSVGATVMENDDVKAFLAKGPSARGSVSVQVNAAITSITTDTDGAAGDLIAPDRRPGVITPPQRRMTVRDLIMPGRTNSSVIEYVKETGFTNNAAVVSEGAQKPESTMKFELMSTSLAVIAHWVQASKQILSDVPMLQSYIDGRLRYGLAYKEELQLLMGSGAAGNLNGIYTQAGAYSAPFAPSSATIIDTLRLALLQASLAEYPADGIVLHPTDWTRVELTKDAENRYIVGNPNSVMGPRLWNQPVVATQAMTIDKFLVGAFKLAAQIFDRWDATVQISTEDRDNFIKNMVTILCEERLGLAVYRPEAFIKGDLGFVG